jgi:SAM-dependent methyltransferase
MSENAQDASPVRAQYESLPYPARDASDETKRLITGSPSHWPEIRHYLFAGRVAPSRRLKILVAGCGTGDAVTMLAQQTADAGIAADILAIDLSDASLGIAKARIEARGLSARVTFKRASLLDAQALGSPFDYIDCCGVLHHLDDPDAGFRALAGALAPKGGMGLMVYGEFGRTGVYEMQQALREIVPDDGSLSPKERVAQARAIIEALPPTNRFRRNGLVKDHLQSDAGLFDLLLHSTDRAYRADDFLGAVEGAGLKLVSWIDPLRYDPALYLPTATAVDQARGLGTKVTARLAESLAGNMRTHILYATRADAPCPPPPGITPDAIPVFRDAQTMQTFHAMPESARALPITIDGLSLSLPLPAGAAALIRLIDGERSLEKIRKSLPDRPDKAAFKARFEGLWRPLHGFSKLFLRR